ncbi:unnamed protein product [Menidia menidia]|uniref:(Atlantic silverside) hypothetical protein n=1 Tax=Menidia menidia TaxID=238744 RepID=A0A8S4BM83_9TELE|nr:unnamed protein product [Menidia menidia]
MKKRNGKMEEEEEEKGEKKGKEEEEEDKKEVEEALRMSSPGEALSLSPEQTRVLEENFRVSRHPDPASVMLIAAECGLTEDQTQVGFLK